MAPSLYARWELRVSYRSAILSAVGHTSFPNAKNGRTKTTSGHSRTFSWYLQLQGNWLADMSQHTLISAVMARSYFVGSLHSERPAGPLHLRENLSDIDDEPTAQAHQISGTTSGLYASDLAHNVNLFMSGRLDVNQLHVEGWVDPSMPPAGSSSAGLDDLKAKLRLAHEDCGQSGKGPQRVIRDFRPSAVHLVKHEIGLS